MILPTIALLLELLAALGAFLIFIAVGLAIIGISFLVDWYQRHQQNDTYIKIEENPE